MNSQKDFFSEFNISDEDFFATTLKWEELLEIYKDFVIYREQLEATATYIFNTLMKVRKVHSVRYRLKDPKHLIEKIIRKKIDNKNSDINIENYKTEVTDLIGVRALHLFKDDWMGIDEFVRENWNLKQKPVANFRKGDSEQLIKIFEELGCETKEHKFGYRSIHYIIESQPAKQKHFAEIQVRTIFEEAWSEIDHSVRYPYDLENPIFSQFLLILNRLAGGADEMGSFLKFLQKELKHREEEFNTQLEGKNKTINELEGKIEKLNLEAEQVASLKIDLEKLRLNQYSSANNYQVNPSRISQTDALLRTISDSKELMKGLEVSPELMKAVNAGSEWMKGFNVSPELMQLVKTGKELHQGLNASRE